MSEKGFVYLTGGSARGARLFSVPGKDVRPALARLRTSVFEILKPRLDDSNVLDLFAGTGSMGLEALSRGAAFGAFIDADPRCADVLRRNLEKLRFADRARVLPGDTLRASDLVASLGKTFDIVFVDPPYAMYDDLSAASKLATAVAALPWSAGGVALVEHRSTYDPGETWAGGPRIDLRRYGGTTVSFYGR